MWLEIVIIGLHSFHLVKKDIVREHVRFGPFFYNTFMSQMAKISSLVEEKVAKRLPDRFELVLNGWSNVVTHYVGIVAPFPSEWKDEGTGYELVLLAPYVLDNMT